MLDRTFFRKFLAITALSIFGVVAHATNLPPDAQVRATTEEVMAALARSKDPQVLREVAETAVVPHFDFERMTRSAVGANWAKATPEQRTALVNEFRQLLVRTYTNALATARRGDTQVDVKAAQPLSGKDEVVVRTAVSESGRKPLAIDYSLARSEAGWKVFDVEVEHVSLIINYRQSFKTQVAQGGSTG